MIRTGLFIMKKMVSSIMFHVKVTMTIIHYKGVNIIMSIILNFVFILSFFASFISCMCWLRFKKAREIFQHFISWGSFPVRFVWEYCFIIFIRRGVVISNRTQMWKSMEQVCSESGLSVSVAFTGVVKKVEREKGILFEIWVNWFYSESNILYRENIVYDIKDVNVRESGNWLLFVIFYNERKFVEE